ncbi:MAG: alpha-E domain-containing protein [Rhizobiaceae bacterium]|jgi:uncharacterized alpha-E superfamily protein|nr:alpha-E domain-containing protein [Rhizobiaceae bacterium]
MLGRTANGIYWMFRAVERSENTARLLEAGLRMSLTRSKDAASEWSSVIETAAGRFAFEKRGDPYTAQHVIDFLLRDKNNPSSVMTMIDSARTNARMVRTALTREVWEATNESWLRLKDALAKPVREAELPKALEMIRRQSGVIRGALHGTMLRNEIYNFARIGTFIERGDNTARILDVKYYVLLPTAQHVGSSLDNVQWESILRSVSAHSSYRYIYDANYAPAQIAEMLILEPRMPRSLAFCCAKITDNLNHLAGEYGERNSCHVLAEGMVQRLRDRTVLSIFDEGLHDFLQAFLMENIRLGATIDREYRFYE